MKKLLYPLVFALTTFLILYSCSAEEEDTTPPPSIIQTPEPEPPAPTQYSLTVTAGEGGTVSTEGGTYDEGTEVTVTATPDEGYEFIGWEGSDIDSSSLRITLNGNTTVQALFQKTVFVSRAPIYSNLNNTVGVILRNKFFPNRNYAFDEGYNLNYIDEVNNDFYGPSDVSSIHFDNNKDGNLDFASVIISNNLNGSKFLLANDVYGTSPTVSIFNSDSNLNPIDYHHRPISRLGDFNNDGNFDIMMSGTNSHNGYDSSGNLLYGENKSFEIYLFQEDGSFTISEVTPTTSVHDYDTGDIDNDGDIDIIFVTYRQDADLTNHKSGYPYIYLNDGQGNFTELNSIEKFNGLDEITGDKSDNESVIYNLTTRLFDIDNDGNLDLLFGGGGYKDVEGQFTPKPSIYWGKENLNFDLNNPTELLLSDELQVEIQNLYEINRGLAILGFSYFDYNNDGDQDILVIGTEDYYGNTYLLFRNNGDRTFTDVTNEKIPQFSQSTNERGGQAYNVYVNDFDNDGDFDLIPDYPYVWYGFDGYYFENTGGQFVRRELD
jgi:hypothetical protein